MHLNVKNILALCGLLLLGMLFYFAEGFIRHQRRAELTEGALKHLEANYLQISSKVASLVNENSLAAFLRLKAVPESFWQQHRELHPMIRGGALFDANGSLVGRSIEWIPRVAIAEKLLNARGTDQLGLLHASGWYQLHSLPDRSAFLLTALSLPRLDQETFTALFEPTTQQTFWSDGELLGEELASRIAELASLLPATGNITLRANGRNYILTTQFWNTTGLIFITLEKERLFYKSVGFFVLAGTIVAFIAGLLFFTLNSKTREILQTERKMSRQILEAQQKTYAHLRDVIHKTAAEPVAAKATSFSEFSFPSAIVSDSDPTPPQPQQQIIYREKEPLVIELVATNRDFIFLDPDFNPPPRTLPEDKRIAELRERSFNPEVIHLMHSVNKPATYSSLMSRIRSIAEMSNRVTIPAWKVFLNEVYFDEITLAETKKMMAYLRELLSADALALLRFNPYIGCYHTFISDGLDSVTETNLYVLSSDQYFPLTKNEQTWHTFSPEAKHNVYLTKRFSAQTLKPLRGYYAIPLHPWHIQGYLVGFFRDDNPARPETHKLPADFHTYLKEAIPAFQYFFKEYFRQNYTDQVTEIVKELRGITGHGRKTAVLIEIHSDAAIDDQSYQRLKRSLQDVLADNERFIYNTPHRLLVILSRTAPDTIMDRLQSLLPNISILIRYFPDEGKNYYLYL